MPKKIVFSHHIFHSLVSKRYIKESPIKFLDAAVSSIEILTQCASYYFLMNYHWQTCRIEWFNEYFVLSPLACCFSYLHRISRTLQWEPNLHSKNCEKINFCLNWATIQLFNGHCCSAHHNSSNQQLWCSR